VGAVAPHGSIFSISFFFLDKVSDNDSKRKRNRKQIMETHVLNTHTNSALPSYSPHRNFRYGTRCGTRYETNDGMNMNVLHQNDSQINKDEIKTQSNSTSSLQERHPQNICQLEWNHKTALDIVDSIIHFYHVGSPTFVIKTAKLGTAIWISPNPTLPYMISSENKTPQETKSNSKCFVWKRWEVKNYPSVNCVYLTIGFDSRWSKEIVRLHYELPKDFSNYLVYNHQDDEITFVCSSIPEGFTLIALFIDFLQGKTNAIVLMKLFATLPLDIRKEHGNLLMLMDRKLHIKKQHLLKYTPLCFHLFHRISRYSE
jgi:hypothetical protein